VGLDVIRRSKSWRLPPIYKYRNALLAQRQLQTRRAHPVRFTRIVEILEDETSWAGKLFRNLVVRLKLSPLELRDPGISQLTTPRAESCRKIARLCQRIPHPSKSLDMKLVIVVTAFLLSQLRKFPKLLAIEACITLELFCVIGYPQHLYERLRETMASLLQRGHRSNGRHRY